VCVVERAGEVNYWLENDWPRWWSDVTGLQSKKCHCCYSDAHFLAQYFFSAWRTGTDARLHIEMPKSDAKKNIGNKVRNFFMLQNFRSMLHINTEVVRWLRSRERLVLFSGIFIRGLTTPWNILLRLYVHCVMFVIFNWRRLWSFSLPGRFPWMSFL